MSSQSNVAEAVLQDLYTAAAIAGISNPEAVGMDDTGVAPSLRHTTEPVSFMRCFRSVRGLLADWPASIELFAGESKINTAYLNKRGVEKPQVEFEMESNTPGEIMASWKPARDGGKDWRPETMSTTRLFRLTGAAHFLKSPEELGKADRALRQVMLKLQELLLAEVEEIAEVEVVRALELVEGRLVVTEPGKAEENLGYQRRRDKTNSRDWVRRKKEREVKALGNITDRQILEAFESSEHQHSAAATLLKETGKKVSRGTVRNRVKNAVAADPDFYFRYCTNLPESKGGNLRGVAQEEAALSDVYKRQRRNALLADFEEEARRKVREAQREGREGVFGLLASGNAMEFRMLLNTVEPDYFSFEQVDRLNGTRGYGIEHLLSNPNLTIEHMKRWVREGYKDVVAGDYCHLGGLIAELYRLPEREQLEEFVYEEGMRLLNLLKSEEGRDQLPDIGKYERENPDYRAPDRNRQAREAARSIIGILQDLPPERLTESEQRLFYSFYESEGRVGDSEKRFLLWVANLPNADLKVLLKAHKRAIENHIYASGFMENRFAWELENSLHFRLNYELFKVLATKNHEKFIDEWERFAPEDLQEAFLEVTSNEPVGIGYFFMHDDMYPDCDKEGLVKALDLKVADWLSQRKRINWDKLKRLVAEEKEVLKRQKERVRKTGAGR